MNTSSIIIVALAGVFVLPACGDETCGPGDAASDGLSVTSAGLQTSEGITYGDGTTSPNNDCSVDEAPTSLTVDIVQLAPLTAQRRALILCVPRPDRLDTELALTDDSVTTGVQVIDIFADDNDCLISIDRTRAISGTATFTGACADGTDPAGYALSLNGEIPATATCPTETNAITLTIAGELAITAL